MASSAASTPQVEVKLPQGGLVRLRLLLVTCKPRLCLRRRRGCRRLLRPARLAAARGRCARPRGPECVCDLGSLRHAAVHPLYVGRGERGGGSSRHAASSGGGGGGGQRRQARPWMPLPTLAAAPPTRVVCLEGPAEASNARAMFTSRAATANAPGTDGLLLQTSGSQARRCCGPGGAAGGAREVRGAGRALVCNWDVVRVLAVFRQVCRVG